MGPAPKMLIIGFDSMDYDIVLDTGILKGFQIRKMLAPEPLTGPGWTTLYTGLPMKDHGITSVHGIYPDKKSKAFGTCRCKFMWEYLNEAGLSVELFALPVTYPPRRVNKYMVSGGIVPDGNYRNPPDLKLDRYYTDIWNYFEQTEDFKSKEAKVKNQYVRHFQGKDRDKPDVGLGKVYSLINDRIMINFINLHSSAHLCFVGFCFLDRVGHWSRFDSFQREYWYDRADQIVEYLKLKFKGYEIMVVSDHGRPVNDDVTKHSKNGVFAYLGKRKLAGKECVQYDFLPTVLSYFNIKYKLQGKNLFGGVK